MRSFPMMQELTFNELDFVTGAGQWTNAIGSAAAGAGAGGAVGAAVGGGIGLLGGPFAPITVTGGATAGGVIGGAAGAIGGFLAGWNNW